MALRRVPCLLARRAAASCAGSVLRPSLALSMPKRGLATATGAPSSLYASLDTFPDRHIGPDAKDAARMLVQLGYESMDAFVADTVPPKIRIPAAVVTNESIPALSESELLQRARQLAHKNKPVKSYIGMGYHNAVVPPVILRNVRTLCLRARAVCSQGDS